MTFIFSIHYFLWYGALTSIFGYESVYARYYTNATTMQFGYLNMVLPFATVIITPIICSFADRHRKHRSYFAASLLITTISMALYTAMPLFMSDEFHTHRRDDLHNIDYREIELSSHKNTTMQEHSSKTEQYAQSVSGGGLFVWPWVYFCVTSLICDLAMGINTCLSDSFAVVQAEEQHKSFGRIMVWGTFGWALSALLLSYINQLSLMPRLVPGLLFGTIMLTLDMLITMFWCNRRDFILDIIPEEAASVVTSVTSGTRHEPLDYMPKPEHLRVNLGIEMDPHSGSVRRKTRSPVQMAAERRAFERRARSADSVSRTVRSDITRHDMSDPTDLTGNNAALLRTDESEPSLDPSKERDFDKRPSWYREAKAMIASTLERARQARLARLARERARPQANIARQQVTSFRMQFLLLGLMLVRRRSLIRYLLLFTLAGFFMSMHWNYFFLYLEKIYDDKFELMSALSMVGQSMIGELPFFILSPRLIDRLGRSHTLSLSVASIGMRFLLYNYMLPNFSPYTIVIADCLQGPNYSLFYVVMTEVGLEYSYCDRDTINALAAHGEIDGENRFEVDALRLSLRSTVQSVAFACYEGLGVGLGSVCGGWLVNTYGFETLWLTMAIFAIGIGALNVCIELCCSEADPQNELSERRDFNLAKRRGTLKSISSPRLLPCASSSLSSFRRERAQKQAPPERTQEDADIVSKPPQQQQQQGAAKNEPLSMDAASKGAAGKALEGVRAVNDAPQPNDKTAAAAT